MRNESKIFHRHLPSLVCMLGFIGGIVVGVIKLYFFHYWKFHFKGDRSSYRFLYHFGKALNHAACAGAFNGRNDETISNKTGRTYRDHGEDSPLWVFAIKWLTDVLDPPEDGRPCHILDSIEPLRPDLDEEKNEMTKPHDPLTYRHPRTLEQAFGPGTPPRVEDPPPPGMDWQDVVVITGCLAVMIAVLVLAFVP